MSEMRITPDLRREVTRRAGECCEYCLSQARYSPDPFSVEHILPRSRGGSVDLSNLAFSCQGCNNRKYNCVEGRDPVSGAILSLFNPRVQRWGDRFAWNDQFAAVLGLTPTGRATIEKLQLNRAGLTTLRRVLRDIGEHPPQVSRN